MVPELLGLSTVSLMHLGALCCCRGPFGSRSERPSRSHAGRLNIVVGGQGESGSIRSVSGATPGYTSQQVPASGAARHAPRATRHRQDELQVTSPAGHRLENQ